MLRLTHLEGRWRRSCCAIVVFLAVAGLAVSVATRYCSPQRSAYSVRTTSHRHSLPELGRQRLTWNAASWVPQVVRIRGPPKTNTFFFLLPHARCVSSL